MKILLLGSTGQVGQELRQTLAAIAPAQVVSWSRADLDLAQLDNIVPAIATLAPDVIVNAAAYTAVDQAESEPDLAHHLNALVPGRLAAASAHCGATLVHISTDYVFDGRQNRPYQPEDVANPLGVYGRTKWAGEEAIRQQCDRHAIVRTAWVYGCHGKGNFVKTMLRLGAERETLRVVIDQVGSPTWAWDLAQAIAALIPRLEPSTYGTYHYTNSGAISWYDFAVAIFEEASEIGYPLRVSQVEPITTDQYPTPATRPAYSVLSGTKLAHCLGSTAPHWRSRLRKMLSDLIGQQF